MNLDLDDIVDCVGPENVAVAAHGLVFTNRNVFDPGNEVT